MANLVLGAGGAAATAYTIDQSLRFDEAGYLSRTPSSTGDVGEWTLSVWIKVCDLPASGGQVILGSDGTPSTGGWIRYNNQSLNLELAGTYNWTTNAVFRDPSAWYHVVFAYDKSQGTAITKCRIYVNGVEQSLSASSNTELDTPFNTTSFEMNVGRRNRSDGSYIPFDGYMAELYWIDGTQYAASDFGELDEDTNQWKPIDASGLTFGTNGFYQKYGDSHGVQAFTSTGANTWTCPAGITSVEILTVAGGGGGGTGDAGGGGAGGVVHHSSYAVTAGVVYDITVGAGGATGTTGASGSDSVFNVNAEGSGATMTAVGGGGGGRYGVVGVAGGSGGGGGGNGASGMSGGSGSQGDSGGGTGYGNDGGDGDGNWTGGGGGGANAVGSNASNAGGAGGAGKLFSTFSAYGASGYFSGGGGGGADDGAGSGGGAGGTGGGGEGGKGTGAAGTANTGGGGGGGGGAGSWYAGGAGGSGVVLIKVDSGFGTDSSGNDNTFATTTLVSTDQMVDSPTNNFCTLNPLFVSSLSNDGSTYSEGNLKVNDASSYYFVATGTQATPTSGKWYFETIATELTATHSHSGAGWSNVDYLQDPSDGPANTSYGYQYSTDGQKVINSTASSFGAAWAVDDVIGFALDLDNGFIYAAKNNTWQDSGDPTSGATGTGALGTSLSGNFTPFGYDGSSSVGLTEIFNLGQDSSFAGNLTAQGNQDENSIGDFYYEPPSGYLALCTSNLDDPEIALPGDYFNTVLWTGNNVDGRVFSSVLDFQLDFSWIKNRTVGYHHVLMDSVREFETDKKIASDLNFEEGDPTELPGTYGYVSAVSSTGFTLSGSSPLQTNSTGDGDYVGWNWLAGGSGVANTTGTMDSTVSANTTAGFSIVTYVGHSNGASNGTVGHGLAEVPTMIIWKELTVAGNNWNVYNADLGKAKRLELNTADAGASDTYMMHNTLPTASVFSVGDSGETNSDGDEHVAYCFHSVEGYSKAGSYTGNGNADGPMAYTGFSPAWIMFKPDGVADWTVCDNKRNTYNAVADKTLNPNLSSLEHDGSMDFDFLSNGFKIRNANQDNNNASAIIYLAFAESPFKYANAR